MLALLGARRQRARDGCAAEKCKEVAPPHAIGSVLGRSHIISAECICAKGRWSREERRLEEVATAFGAHGECVREPEEVPATIERCFAALADGRSAVLRARVTPL
jgi:hypothetical protein